MRRWSAMVLIVGLGGARLALGSETTAQITAADPIKAESAASAVDEKDASAAGQEADTGWRVEIDVDEGNPPSASPTRWKERPTPFERPVGPAGWSYSGNEEILRLVTCVMILIAATGVTWRHAGKAACVKGRTPTRSQETHHG